MLLAYRSALPLLSNAHPHNLVIGIGEMLREEEGVYRCTFVVVFVYGVWSSDQVRRELPKTCD